jgi:hypothetical protein
MPISKAILQQMAQSAYSGKTRPRISHYTLVFATPTLKFYKDERSKLIIVAIRGTALSDPEDIKADMMALLGQLRQSTRYAKDKLTLEKVQETYPRPEYRYIAVGHSLGGGILDLFLRDGLIQNGMSYNPLIEPNERVANPRHLRIYHKDDPLYKLFGNSIPNVEVRTTAEPFWKYALKSTLPEPLGEAFEALDRHKIRIFKGGAIQSAFRRQLMELQFSQEDYLKEARAKAEAAGYDPEKVDFSDNKTHKLRIETPDGRIVRFGRVSYNDSLIWNHLESAGQVEKGTAKQNQERFVKSHMKIKGKWKTDDYSPNWLALRILW